MLFPAELLGAKPIGDEPKGIAGLAARSRTLRAKRRVEYFELPSRSLLNRCSNPRMPFQWTINPYRGCEYGCQYCYARYTHEFMGMSDGEEFERKIYAKEDVAGLLRRDLRRHRTGAIAIGTSTDPYQPAERRYDRTRTILEVFTEVSGRQLAITTKSDLVARDAELLRRISERNRLSVNITVTTMDEGLARLLEPYAPRPALRLEALTALAAAGVETGVFLNPIQPGITSTEESLTAVARAAKRAGASFLGEVFCFSCRAHSSIFFLFWRRSFRTWPRLTARTTSATPTCAGSLRRSLRREWIAFAPSRVWRTARSARRRRGRRSWSCSAGEVGGDARHSLACTAGAVRHNGHSYHDPAHS